MSHVLSILISRESYHVSALYDWLALFLSRNTVYRNRKRFARLRPTYIDDNVSPRRYFFKGVLYLAHSDTVAALRRVGSCSMKTSVTIKVGKSYLILPCDLLALHSELKNYRIDLRFLIAFGFRAVFFSKTKHFRRLHEVFMTSFRSETCS